MIKIYDYQKKQVLQLKDEEATTKLILYPNQFGPIRNEKYMVINDETGEGKQVLGQNLRQELGNNNSLMDINRFNIRQMIQAENSQFGVLGKAAVEEALMLGLPDLFRSGPSNPFEQMIEEEYQKEFGTSSAIGKGLGLVGPFLAGGIGGVIHAGAKQAVKGAVKTGLNLAGKLPSAQVLKGAIKASDKAGALAAKGVQKLGAGKGIQKAAEVAGKGLGFAGAEAAIQGTIHAVGAGVKEARSPLKDAVPERGKVERIMNQAIGRGVEVGAEVFKSTAVWMGGAGAIAGAFKVTGKGIQLSGKVVERATGWGAKKSREVFLGTNVGAFFSNKLARKSMNNLRTAFGLQKRAEDADILRTASKYLTDRFGKQTFTRNKAIEALHQDTDKLGKALGAVRKTLDEAGADVTKPFLNHIQALKNIPDDLAKKTWAKPYINNLEKIQSDYFKRVKVTKKPPMVEVIDKFSSFKKEAAKKVDLTPVVKEVTKLQKKALFGDIKKATNIFDEGAKFEKGAKPTRLNKLYRMAYNRSTNLENKMTKAFEHKMGVDIIQYDKLKRAYHKSRTIKDIIDSGIKPGAQVADFYLMRDLFHVAMTGIGVGALGGRTTGTMAAVGLFGGMTALRSTGYKLLNFANNLDKVNGVMKNAKSPKGVNHLLSKTLGIREPVRLASLGHFFFNKPIKSMEEFDETLAGYNEVERVSTGQEDAYLAAQEYGGQEMALRFNNSVIDMKNFILQTKPKPFIHPDTGQAFYSDIEKDLWLNDLSATTSIQGFLDAMKSKSLTKKQYDDFSKLYPRFLMDFNVSLTQGLRNGSLEKTDVIESYMSLMRSSVENDMVFFTLDQMTLEKERGRRQNRSNRKFTPQNLTSRSVSDQARSGSLQ